MYAPFVVHGSLMCTAVLDRQKNGCSSGVDKDVWMVRNFGKCSMRELHDVFTHCLLCNEYRVAHVPHTWHLFCTACCRCTHSTTDCSHVSATKVPWSQRILGISEWRHSDVYAPPSHEGIANCTRTHTVAYLDFTFNAQTLPVLYGKTFVHSNLSLWYECNEI